MAGFNVNDDPTTNSGAKTGAVSTADIARAQEQIFAPGRSSRDKYQDLVVGRPGFAALAKYELVVMLCQGLAGAAGLAMRQMMYPWLLGSCGRGVVFGQNVVLRHPHKIHIGSNVVIDDNCLVDAKGDTNLGIRIGNGVFIGRNTILSCKNGDIQVADRAELGFNCDGFSASRVTIGRNVLIAAYSYIIGGDHDFSDPAQAVISQPPLSAGDTIRRRAGVGAGGENRDRAPIRGHPARCPRAPLPQ